jgi:ABC-type phosphate transport system permease subunit
MNFRFDFSGLAWIGALVLVVFIAIVALIILLVVHRNRRKRGR